MKCMHRVMAFGRFYQDHFTSTKQSVRSPGALEREKENAAIERPWFCRCIGSNVISSDGSTRWVPKQVTIH